MSFAIYGHGVDSVSAFDERSAAEESYWLKVGSELIRLISWIKDAYSSGRFFKNVQSIGYMVIGDRSERRKDFDRLQNEYYLVK
ncbi:MAG: hypothetical protein U9N36_09315 [Euryarchaeota archaeon]|nr:hypothetical protein [Euryarchaeota archaeon]